MKALVLTDYLQLTYQDVERPPVGADEVLVRVHACGICGSDIHGLDGSSGRRIPPLIMGHEAAGVIVAVGERVEGWRTGDRVTFDSTLYCGACFYCKQGLVDLCDSRQVIGVAYDEFRREGAFAEYVTVPALVLYRIPAGISFPQAALAEPLSVALHAVKRAPQLLNKNAVVIGAGMIGLLIIQLLRAAGCAQIIAVDLNAGRLAFARRLGATESLNADEVDVPAAVKALTEDRGADVAFEVVGISPTVNQAIHSLRKGGWLTLVGNLATKIDFPLQAVVTRELTLGGIVGAGANYAESLDLICRGVIDTETIISVVAPLAEGGEWFLRLREPGSDLLKVILVPPLS